MVAPANTMTTMHSSGDGSGGGKTTTNQTKVNRSSTDHQAKYALAVAQVVTELIEAYNKGTAELNFTKLKSRASKQYHLQGTPKLADILQALPLVYRDKLRPYLQTKPVRTIYRRSRENSMYNYIVLSSLSLSLSKSTTRSSC